VNQAPNG